MELSAILWFSNGSSRILVPGINKTFNKFMWKKLKDKEKWFFFYITSEWWFIFKDKEMEINGHGIIEMYIFIWKEILYGHAVLLDFSRKYLHCEKVDYGFLINSSTNRHQNIGCINNPSVDLCWKFCLTITDIRNLLQHLCNISFCFSPHSWKSLAHNVAHWASFWLVWGSVNLISPFLGLLKVW